MIEMTPEKARELFEALPPGDNTDFLGLALQVLENAAREEGYLEGCKETEEKLHPYTDVGTHTNDEDTIFGDLVHLVEPVAQICSSHPSALGPPLISDEVEILYRNLRKKAAQVAKDLQEVDHPDPLYDFEQCRTLGTPRPGSAMGVLLTMHEDGVEIRQSHAAVLRNFVKQNSERLHGPSVEEDIPLDPEEGS